MRNRSEEKFTHHSPFITYQLMNLIDLILISLRTLSKNMLRSLLTNS